MRATRPSLLLLSRATLFNPFYWGPQGHHYYYCQGLPSQNKVYCFALYFIELELETNTGSYSWCHRGSWHHMIIFHKKQDCRKMLYLTKNDRCLWELPHSFSNWSIFSTSPHSKKLTLVMKHSISLEHWTSIWLCEIPLDQ